ncbi:linaridin-like RiPP [Micromonospora sp. NPDC049175]|uniref:linaridin-like RiPP n=1 Tax=Micromonospora sp. NPDC049175 TaxID=3364266 RepID=UPI00371E9B47
MSLVAHYANEILPDVSPGMLTQIEIVSPFDGTAEPVLFTPLTITCPEVTALAGAALAALAANVNNYVARNAY